jgi:uncharacterized protein YcbX
MPRLARITVYPIKSFDGVDLGEASFNSGGGLANDRRFAFRTDRGELINGKKFPKLHALRSRYSADFAGVEFTLPDGTHETFSLAAGDDRLNRRMSEFLEVSVRLAEDAEVGFLDDLDSPGPTVISTASLETVASWYLDLPLDEVRRRFRANLEIADCPAFWEDRLFAEDASPQTRTVVPFRVGAVVLHGVNPCARCPVPTRDTQSGEPYPRFAQIFQSKRRETLPAWAPPTAFDHYYRLSVNTRLSPTSFGGRIAVGDEVELVATP